MLLTLKMKCVLVHFFSNLLCQIICIKNIGFYSDVNDAAHAVDPRHDNPIAGQRKRNSHPSCVSLSQHINLITSLHLRQRWGIWGHHRAFGMTRFWWDLNVCCLKSMLRHSWWGSLSLSPHKGMSHKGNAWVCESIGEKTHYRLFVCMRKAFSFRNMLTTETKEKRTQFRCRGEIKNLSGTRASVNCSSGGDWCTNASHKCESSSHILQGSSILLIGNHQLHITHDSGVFKWKKKNAKKVSLNSSTAVSPHYN